MRLKRDFMWTSAIVRVIAVSAVAGALGACSSDVARFSENPFSNPYKTASGPGVDRGATGSIRSAPATSDVAAAVPSAGRVSSQPLAAPTVTGSIAPRPAMPSASLPAASAPVASLPAASAPSAVSLARASARTASGWSAAGGTPVTVAAGESAATLSSRYGVPASAIISANGLSSGKLTPGSQVIIPVFNAGGSPAAAAPAASIAPRAEAPIDNTPPVTPRPVQPAPRAQMSERAEPIRAPAPKPAEAPKPAVPVRSAAAAAPPQRDTAAPRMTPPAPIAPPKVAEPKAVNSAASDAAREKARAQAEAARLRSESVRQQSVASVRAEAEAKARKAAEAKAQAEAEKARLAELKAQTSAEKAKAAEARKAAEAERAKAAEAKAKAEADRKLAAEAKARAEREAKVARAEAEQPAAAAAATRGIDPNATASIPKDEPKQATADFRWPARGRVINGFSGRGGNEGINIAVPEGTPVKAAGDGVVAYSGNELKGYGNLVLIRHENGYVSAYAHNGDIAVKRGERVSRGQVIARSGQTGNVSSPQLHFEIRKGSNPVDPMPYLNN